MKIKNLALICAKKKSYGLKNKNLRKINNKSLFEITCEHVKKSKLINHTLISTDSKKILKIGKKYNFDTPFLRPKKLSLKITPEWKVWQHAIEYFKVHYGYIPQALIVCSCTSPKRDPKIIDEAIKKFYKTKSDVILSITETSSNPEFNLVKIKKNNLAILAKPKKKKYNRQDLDTIYKITTNVYVLKAEFILKKNHLFDTKKINYVFVSKKNAIDIDDYYDYEIAKKI
jgi:CMP-N-acetylneuraminic acid synthetase